MRSIYKAAIVTILVIIFLANPALLAWGNPVPGRWEKVAETKPGDWMKIYTQDGTQRKYRFVSLNDELLHCVNNYGEKISIDLITIDKIILPKAGKYAKEWALWGALGGAAIPGIPILIGHAQGGGSEFTGIGALGGLLAGAALGAPGETVYISKEAAMEAARK